MRVSQHPEYRQFIEAMRRNSEDAVTPLVFADWLEEHSKPEWAEFIRLCVEYKPRWLMFPNRGRLLCERYCHEWTGLRHETMRKDVSRLWGGAFRPEDFFYHGFMRVWYFNPSRSEEASASYKRLQALLDKQPIDTIRVEGLFKPPPEHVVKHLASQFPGVEFVYGLNAAIKAKVPKE